MSHDPPTHKISLGEIGVGHAETCVRLGKNDPRSIENILESKPYCVESSEYLCMHSLVVVWLCGLHQMVNTVHAYVYSTCTCSLVLLLVIGI